MRWSVLRGFVALLFGTFAALGLAWLGVTGTAGCRGRRGSGPGGRDPVDGDEPARVPPARPTTTASRVCRPPSAWRPCSMRAEQPSRVGPGLERRDLDHGGAPGAGRRHRGGTDFGVVHVGVVLRRRGHGRAPAPQLALRGPSGMEAAGRSAAGDRAQGSADAELTGVSCTGPTWCMATGIAADSTFDVTNSFARSGTGSDGSPPPRSSCRRERSPSCTSISWTRTDRLHGRRSAVQWAAGPSSCRTRNRHRRTSGRGATARTPGRTTFFAQDPQVRSRAPRPLNWTSRNCSPPALPTPTPSPTHHRVVAGPGRAVERVVVEHQPRRGSRRCDRSGVRVRVVRRHRFLHGDRRLRGQDSSVVSFAEAWSDGTWSVSSLPAHPQGARWFSGGELYQPYLVHAGRRRPPSATDLANAGGTFVAGSWNGAAGRCRR